MSEDRAVRVSLKCREVMLRLEAHSSRPSLLGEGMELIIGDIRESEFRLSVNRGYANPWGTTLHGWVQDRAEGSIVRVRLEGDALSVREMLAIAFMILWGTMFFVAALPSPTVPLRDKVFGSVAFIVITGFCIGLRWFCRRLARGENETLKRFLDDLLRDVTLPEKEGSAPEVSP